MKLNKVIFFTVIIVLLSSIVNADQGWMLQSSGITGKISTIQFVDENIGWAICNDFNMDIVDVLHTIDGGGIWTIQDTVTQGIYNNITSMFFTDMLNGWLVGGNGEIFHTTDSGQTWQSQSSFGPQYYFSDVYFFNDNLGIIVGSDYSNDIGLIVKTVDGGNTWNVINSNVLQGNYLTSVFIVEDSTVWAAGYEDVGQYWHGVIFESEDQGNSWHINATGIHSTIHGNGRLEDIFFVNNNIGWAVGYSGMIVKTSDAGSSWQVQNQEGNSFHSVSFVDENTGWAVGAYGQICMTTNGGNFWSNQVSNTGKGLNSVIFIDQQHGWAAGSNWPGGGEAIILHYGELPSWFENNMNDVIDNQYSLYQNYPNPFNPKTTVKYEIPKTSNIKIVLYNSIGQKIKTLYSGEQMSGLHSMEVDGDNLPSGVYIYKIEAGDYQEARKCLLLK